MGISFTRFSVLLVVVLLMLYMLTIMLIYLTHALRSIPVSYTHLTLPTIYSV